MNNVIKLFIYILYAFFSLGLPWYIMKAAETATPTIKFIIGVLIILSVTFMTSLFYYWMHKYFFRKNNSYINPIYHLIPKTNFSFMFNSLLTEWSAVTVSALIFGYGYSHNSFTVMLIALAILWVPYNRIIDQSEKSLYEQLKVVRKQL